MSTYATGYHRPRHADRIEREHGGQRLPDIIRGYRQAGSSWTMIASIFRVRPSTVRYWRAWYKIESSGYNFDFKPGPPRRDQELAEQHGYEDMAALLYDWRLTLNLTTRQCAERLGVSLYTIWKYTPSELRGVRHNTDRNKQAAVKNLAKARAAQDVQGRVGIKFGKHANDKGGRIDSWD